MCKIIDTQFIPRCLDPEFNHEKWTHHREAASVFSMLCILMEIMAFKLYTFLGGDVNSYQMALVHGNNWSLTKICHSETLVLFYFLNICFYFICMSDLPTCI